MNLCGQNLKREESESYAQMLDLKRKSNKILLNRLSGFRFLCDRIGNEKNFGRKQKGGKKHVGNT